MKKILIVPIDSASNGKREAIYACIREFPIEKMVLVGVEKNLSGVMAEKTALDTIQFHNEVLALKAASFDEVFESLAYLQKKHPKSEFMINLGLAHGALKHLYLSGAFVQGISTVDFDPEQSSLTFFPILKLPYSAFLSDKKMTLLRVIGQHGRVNSLDELAKKAGMGASLINYHLSGNLEASGLIGLGLVKGERQKGKLTLQLTDFGKLLLKASPVLPSEAFRKP